MRRWRERCVHGQTVNPDACERGAEASRCRTRHRGNPKTSKTRSAAAWANTSRDTGKSSMPEDEAWSSLRLCQQPLAAAAGNARTPRRPEGVTKAPALGGRDFGAAAVTEWRCDKVRRRRPAIVRGPERGCAVACSHEHPQALKPVIASLQRGRAHGCCRHPTLRLSGREFGAAPGRL